MPRLSSDARTARRGVTTWHDLRAVRHLASRLYDYTPQRVLCYTPTLADAPPSVRSSSLVSTREPFTGAAMHDFIIEHLPSVRQLCALGGCVSLSLLAKQRFAILHARPRGARHDFRHTRSRYERWRGKYSFCCHAQPQAPRRNMPFFRLASHHWQCASEAYSSRRNDFTRQPLAHATSLHASQP